MTAVSPTTIAPPEPDLTPDEMLRRAQSMRSVLRERQAECESLGRLPESTNKEFVTAGFYRILQPRRFGGYEFDVPAFVRVMSEVARGCPSSGWVLALTSGHTQTMAYMSEQAQAEAYASAGEFRAPFVASPSFMAKPCDGGYTLTGGWDYSSGCDIATHFLGHVLMPPAEQGAMPTVSVALIARGDFTIVDNWDVVGMRGTGSRRVVVDNVFVPAHRVAPSPLFATEAPLPCIHPNPMYRGRVLALLMMELSAVAVGIGYAALDACEDIMRNKRVNTPLSSLRFEDATYQQIFGRAAALLMTARAALYRIAEDYVALCRRQADGGEPFSDTENQGMFLVEQQIVRLAGEAVDAVFRTGGSSAGRSAEPLQRYMRDMTFLRTHMGLQHELSERGYAKLHFGLKTEGPFG